VEPLFRKVDCVQLKVDNLETALSFYSSRLGHTLKWKTETSAGLSMADADTELVIHTGSLPPETDLLVSSVPEAVKQFLEAGGKVIIGPFDILIGLCAVVEDPWANRMVILDMSKGKLKVDEQMNVI